VNDVIFPLKSLITSNVMMHTVQFWL